MEHKSTIYTTNILDIVQVAIMAAIICIVTFVVKVPTYTGYTHIGDSMVLLSVLLLGRRKGVLSSAIGMGLTDIISGYLAWAPFTIVIKSIMAFIAGTILYKNKDKKYNIPVMLLAFTVACIWMIFGYYVSGAIMTRFIFLKTATFNQSLILALREVPSNMVQSIVGIVIAIPLGRALKKSKLVKN